MVGHKTANSIISDKLWLPEMIIVFS